jgi:hypothetical protein
MLFTLFSSTFSSSLFGVCVCVCGMNLRLMGLNESDSGKDEERSFHPARPSRSLRSNFIRFGRSFFPTSNRWGETVRRSARRTPSAGRQMMSLVHLPGSSSRR